MQHASCSVRINGDIGNIAVKAPVTPAEVVMLRAIHGSDTVFNVTLLNGGVNDKTPHAEELARLKVIYTAQNEDSKAIIDSVFPGHSPQLPTTFAEIGIGVGVNEGKAIKPKGRGKAAVEAAEALAGDDAGDDEGDEEKSED